MSLRTVQSENKTGEKEEDTCALPGGQMVKYPYGPLVQRHGSPCSPSVSSSVLSLATLVSHSFAARTGALRLSCVRASTSLLSQPPAPFKYQGELRLGRRAPPTRGFHWSASHRVHYRPTNGSGGGTCQSMLRSNPERAGRPAAIGGCYRGMVFVVRELWNSL